jgi:hypothetical protein
MGVRWNRALASASVVLVGVSLAGPLPARAEVVGQSVSGGPSALSGDFDGDGRSDTALAGAYWWKTVPVARTTTSGLTVTKASSPAFAAAAAKPNVQMVTGDLDGDQDDDIVLVGATGWTSLPVARSNRDGTFMVSNAATGSFPAWAAQAGVQVASGDFNHDGRTDLALAGGELTTIPVAMSTGSGFTVTNASVPQFTQQASADGARVLTGDFDGDGRTDLAAVPRSVTDDVDESLVLALSNGNGTFRQASTPESESDFVANIDGGLVTAGDFDGDGRTDLTVVARNSVLIAYSAGSDGTFSLTEAQATSAFYTQASRNVRILAGDYNCDGSDDLAVIPKPGSSAQTILIGQTTNDPETLSVTSNLPQFTQLAKATGAQILQGDYNNDNCDDIALTGGAGWTTTPTAISDNGTLIQQDPTAPDFAAWAAGTATPVTMPPPPATNPNGTLSILDTEAWSGIMSSVTIGTDGLGIIAYRVTGPVEELWNLRVAHCNDLACTSVTTTDVDSIGDVGLYSSIKIGNDGLPLISYVAFRDANHQFLDDLRVAHCNDVACTSATITTLASAPRVTYRSPLTIGADGLGLIVYRDTPLGASVDDLWVAHCKDIACTSATHTHIARPGAVGNGASYLGIATGANGFGVISYYDRTGEMVKVVVCGNADCTTRTTSIVDQATNPSNERFDEDTTVTIGLDGLPLISYNRTFLDRPGQLKVAHCSNPQCTQSTRTVADDGQGGRSFANGSITIGGDGLGVISYWDITNRDLKVAHCIDLTCSAVTKETIDSFGSVGNQSSITVGTDGLPLISYLGEGFTGPVLKVVHCGNPDCTAPLVTPFLVPQASTPR